jgi:hypothetical protein
MTAFAPALAAVAATANDSRQRERLAQGFPARNRLQDVVRVIAHDQILAR